MVQLPDFSAARETPTQQEATEEERSRAGFIVLGVVAGVLMLLLVTGLILSQTVFRGVDLEGGNSPGPDGPVQNSPGEGEYVPDQNDPNIAPPPPMFTEAPTSSCYIPPDQNAPVSSGDQIRGGDLQYTAPRTWDMDWDTSPLPYVSEVGARARNVEGSWYSVVNVGRVEYPEDEGYPGLEDAAVDIFQCYATTSGVLVAFGEHPLVTDYRSVSTTVDGHEAWIVQATYHFEDPGYLDASSASVVTAIVVDTPNGPSALASDVAADVEEHRAELDQIIESLQVVG